MKIEKMIAQDIVKFDKLGIDLRPAIIEFCKEEEKMANFKSKISLISFIVAISFIIIFLFKMYIGKT